MVAARQQDPKLLAEAYRDVEEVVLSIDGLQPEKGHETLYVVRELTGKRVWFAESLISSSEAEVRRLIVRARQWAERLGKRVGAWVSDKQDAFVKGIAAEFPGVAHQQHPQPFLVVGSSVDVLEIDHGWRSLSRSHARRWSVQSRFSATTYA